MPKPSKWLKKEFTVEPMEDFYGCFRVLEYQDTGGSPKHDKALATLFSNSTELLAAAEDVVKCWESGDLAGAVRRLDAAVDAAKGVA